MMTDQDNTTPESGSATVATAPDSGTSRHAVTTQKPPKMFLDSTVLNNPASAGVITMLITSTLGQQLNIPANWAAMTISLVIGGWVWGELNLHWSRRLISHLTNAFVIFMIASGVNASSLSAFQQLSSAEDQAVERQFKIESKWLDGWKW